MDLKTGGRQPSPRIGLSGSRFRAGDAAADGTGPSSVAAAGRHRTSDAGCPIRRGGPSPITVDDRHDRLLAPMFGAAVLVTARPAGGRRSALPKLQKTSRRASLSRRPNGPPGSSSPTSHGRPQPMALNASG